MTQPGGQKRLTDRVDRFPKARILVVGDIVLDHYIWGKVSRISPEAPVPVVNVTRENVLLGGAANVAQNIRSLNGGVGVCGVIGRDDAGDRLMRLLQDRDIDDSGIILDPERPTTVKTRIIAHNQQVVRFDRETKDRIGKEMHSRICDFVERSIAEGIDAIVLSDYCKGVVTADLVREVVRLARKKDVIVSVDPKVSHFGMYRGVTILTPNAAEASLGSRIEIEDEQSLLAAGAALLRRVGSKAVLITRGEHGMSLFAQGGKVTHIPTKARAVYDVTGAGDTVIAVLTLAMAAGANAADASRIANYAAGIVVGVVGTATVTPAELKERIREG